MDLGDMLHGRRNKLSGGWTFPKPGGGSIYCSRGGSLLVRNIHNHRKQFRVYLFMEFVLVIW